MPSEEIKLVKHVARFELRALVDFPRRLNHCSGEPQPQQEAAQLRLLLGARPLLEYGTDGLHQEWTVDLLGKVFGIGSKIVNKSGEGLFLDIILGIIGAFVGGFLFSLVGAQGVSGVNIWSLVVATVGAIVVLVVYHAIRRA